MSRDQQIVPNDTNVSSLPLGCSRRAMIVVNVIFCALMLPCGFFGMVFVLFLDAPGSTTNPMTWLVGAIIVSYPLTCILSVIFSTRWWCRGWARAAWAVTWLPLLQLALLPLLDLLSLLLSVTK